MKVKIGSREFTIGEWYKPRYIHSKPRKLLGVSKPDGSWVQWSDTGQKEDCKITLASQWDAEMSGNQHGV